MEENNQKLFDTRIGFPDNDARDRLARLVGLDSTKALLARSIAVLVNPGGLRTWASQHHAEDIDLLRFVAQRPPLIILAGDVGTGKTELATAIADPVARQEEIEITLLPLSLSTRGSGNVGEMTRLLSAAFDEAHQTAKLMKGQRGKASGAVILLVDEADAIVQSRENSQMHHEDRAGVNAFIRGVNHLTAQGLPIVVILCTNRLSEIDPAVRRRASYIFELSRPNDEQRSAVISPPLTQIGFSPGEISELVKATGPTGAREYGFTYSDLTQRFLPALVLDAYPNRPVSFDRAHVVLSGIQPTPPFQEDKDR